MQKPPAIGGGREGGILLGALRGQSFETSPCPFETSRAYHIGCFVAELREVEPEEKEGAFLQRDS